MGGGIRGRVGMLILLLGRRGCGVVWMVWVGEEVGWEVLLWRVLVVVVLLERML